MSRITTGLADGTRLLAPTKRAAYVWATFSLLSLLAVITGAGGLPSLVAGFLAGFVGTLRLQQLFDRDYRADVESWEADTRDADVAWWMDRLHYSDLPQERAVADALLLHWGARTPVTVQRQAVEDALQVSAWVDGLRSEPIRCARCNHQASKGMWLHHAR